MLEEVQNPEEVLEESQEEEVVEALDSEEIPACVEALLFANAEPLTVEKICEVTEISQEDVTNALQQVKSKYAQPGYGFELLEIAGAFQFRTRSLFAPYIRMLRAKKPRRLSPPALETLAIIAYRQPIVRADIEKIRGVDASPTIKTLLDRKLVKIVGHQSSVGQPALYGTTEDFLKLFGMSDLTELPSLRDLKEIDREPGEPEDAGLLEPEAEVQQGQ